MDTYLKEIARTPLLTAGEERELATRARQGDREARDRMIKANLRLVVSIARYHRGKGLPMEDLIEEGNVGLFTAIDKFDPTRGFRFSTYASFWIRQFISAAICDKARTIRIPRYAQDLIREWKRARQRLASQGKRATTKELVAAMHLTPKKAAVVCDVLRIRYDRQTGGDELNHLDEVLPGHESDVGAQIDQADEERRMRDVLGELSERDQYVIRKRFGFDGCGDVTLAQLGKALGVTRERVRQIQDEAIEKLREKMVHAHS